MTQKKLYTLNQRKEKDKLKDKKAQKRRFLLLSLLLISVIGFVIQISFVSSAIVGGEWKVIKFDGNEKELYDISKLNNNQICLKMINEDLSNIIIEEKIVDTKIDTKEIINKELSEVNEEKIINEKIISYPTSLNVYEGKNKILKETRTLKKSNVIEKALNIKNEECFNLDKEKGKYQIGENSIVISFEHSYTIHNSKFQGWKVSFTGNESILWSLASITNDEICISPKDKSLNDINVISCKEYDNETCIKNKTDKYKYPNKIKIKDKLQNIKQEVSLISGTEEYCFSLSPIINLWYKIGDNSIVIDGETTYNSTNLNVTQENKFFHLNISNQNILYYNPLDLIIGTNSYDYSNNSYDGNIINAVINTWGIIGNSYLFNGFGSFVSIPNINWITKSYWINDSEGVKHILVEKDNETYVNGVLACPEGMAYINKLGGYCIDKYEASASGCENIGDNCASAQTDYCTACTPTSGVFGSVSATTGTTVNASSKANVAPLVRVSQLQARQMCSNVGKHLCSDAEWLGAANILGQVYNLTADLAVSPYRCVTGSSTWCNYSTNPRLNYACNTSLYSGGLSNCSSAEGVYGMTGNVWEWTNETVNTTKPTSCNPTVNGNCYINATSGEWQTSSTSPIYGNDYTYFLANNSLNKAVRRGGSWSTGAGAGPFCSTLPHGPSGVSISLGFRCCSGLN